MGVLSFWFWSFCFWNLSLFVFILDAIFCGTNFFIFQDIVWLVKLSWCVHCCSVQQLHWVSYRCGSEFELWWFFVRKKLSSQYWQFFFLFGLGFQTILELSQNWKSELLFWVDNAFSTCWCYLGVLNNWVHFFSVESCLFICLSVMRFFLLQVFPFLITVSGWYYQIDVLIFIHLFSYTGIVLVAQVNLCWRVFVLIKLSRIGSYH